MIKQIVCYLFIVHFIYCVQNVEAFDDQVSHPDITENAITIRFDQYLKNNLGLQEGKQTQLNFEKTNLSIVKWLTKGSTDEDRPLCRASNHFHDPLLEPWNLSYVSDMPTPFNAKCEKEEKKGTGYFIHE